MQTTERLRIVDRQIVDELALELAELPARDDTDVDDVEQLHEQPCHPRVYRGFRGRQGVVEVEGDQPRGCRHAASLPDTMGGIPDGTASTGVLLVEKAQRLCFDAVVGITWRDER